MIKIDEKLYNKMPSDIKELFKEIQNKNNDEVLALFPETSKQGGRKNKDSTSIFVGGSKDSSFYGDSGSAARFFYCAKASPKERNEGLDGLEKGNSHPTVKPLSLMEYFVKLLTKPGDIVCDLFAGSGTTGKACVKTDRKYILIELGKQYIPIIFGRISHSLKNKLEEENNSNKNNNFFVSKKLKKEK